MADLLPGVLTEHLTDNSGCFVRSTAMLARVHSPYQEVELHHTVDFGKLLRIDGHFMTSELDEFVYHELLVHLAAISHDRPETALIIGGGDGGAAEELLKHRTIAEVTMVEIDQAVIDLCRTHLGEIHRGAFDDPRLTLEVTDGFGFVAASGPSYDLIVLDLTDPGGPSTPLFTEEFYRHCARRLNAGGALTLQIASPIAHADLVKRVIQGLRAVFGVVIPLLAPVPLYNGLWMLGFASDSLRPGVLTAAEVDRRVGERGLDGLLYYNGDMHHAAMAQPNFVRKLVA